MADPSQQAFLNSVFQWTMENATTEDESVNNDASKPNEMDPEKKKWLSEALERKVLNPVDRMKLCLEKLKDEQETEKQKEEFLQELLDWVEELDLAKDFFTIGGLEILNPLLSSLNPTLCAGGCSLIANLVQNNDHCQRIIVQSGLQEKLLKLVDTSEDPEVKTKSVTAVSALVRGYTLGQLQLQKYQGITILIRALSAPIPRLQNKLCFLINTLCSSSAHMHKLFFEKGVFQALMHLANDPSCPDYLHVLQTIKTMADGRKPFITALLEKEPELAEQFESTLSRKRSEIIHFAEHHDDVVLMNEIRSIIHGTLEPVLNSPANVAETEPTSMLMHNTT